MAEAAAVEESSSAEVLPSSAAKFRQVPLTCRGHTRPVVYLEFSEQSQYGYFVISACKDGKPMLRYGDTGDWIGTFIGHKGAVWCCALNPDATVAATASADFTAKTWNGETGDELLSIPHNHIVRSIHLARDSKRLLTASKNKVFLYDLSAPAGAQRECSGHEGAVKRCCFLPDGNTVLSCAEDNTVRLWELATGGELAKATLPASPVGMQLSSDGSVLTVAAASQVLFYSIPRCGVDAFSTADDDSMVSRDLGNPTTSICCALPGRPESMTILKSVDVGTPVFSASLSPDKATFIFGGEDFNVHRWNYNTEKEIASYRGHFGPVHCVRFSPDGQLYASGSEDGILRLWRTDLSKSYGLWRVNGDE